MHPVLVGFKDFYIAMSPTGAPSYVSYAEVAKLDEVDTMMRSLAY